MRPPEEMLKIRHQQMRCLTQAIEDLCATLQLPPRSAQFLIAGALEQGYVDAVNYAHVDSTYHPHDLAVPEN